jgi:FkbM family methyltransferase
LVQSERERQLLRDFFGETPGFFVDVGANHPSDGSQSWHLEERGWNGVLVEPQPDLAQDLAQVRKAKVFAVACSSPENVGRRLPLHIAGPMSSLDRDEMAPGSKVEAVIEVPVRTLDDILTESGAPAPIDFLSVDVEGHEIEVLRGLDVCRWRPRLIVVEDHVRSLTKHRFMKSIGYRLVRRIEFNGWYVPADSSISFDWADRMRIWRKYYLGLPFRMIRDASRRMRQRRAD